MSEAREMVEEANVLDTLPNELFLEIVDYLMTTDPLRLTYLCAVSRRLYDFCQDLPLRRRLIDYWKPRVAAIIEDIRSSAEDPNEVDVYGRLPKLPPMPEWLAEAAGLI